MGTIKPDHYRKDIDGLRAVAVLSVIIFHMGYLPNGYLGVDIFFVISGYLITKIVHNEALENRFSIINFYMRRIRRIIPLVVFTTFIALLTGIFVMLPDDLENLSQSVIATNLFANNILLLKTSGNYWDIFNDYKPLMHTWSLGVEEQFYLIYPLIFLALTGGRKKWILPLLITLTLVSLYLYLTTTNTTARFYLIQYRFFELALGGLGAILFRNKVLDNRYKVGLLLIILLVLLFGMYLSPVVGLLLVVLSSVGLLLPGGTVQSLSNTFLEHKYMVWVGKISFSLYMWHQIVLAYSRYFVIEGMNVIYAVLLFMVTLMLSVLSYQFIEQPFRDKTRVSSRMLLSVSAVVLALTSVSSLFLYMRAGVIRDVPELGLYATNSNIGVNSHLHQAYNSRIYDLDRQFSNNNKIKALVIGNSYARDWSNILLESKYGRDLEICYTYNIATCKNIQERIAKADVIFFSEMRVDTFRAIASRYHIDTTKVWIVGNKNFGANNGIFYNRRGDDSYCVQRVNIRQQALEINRDLKAQWGDKYIDLIGMVIDEEGKVPVFTDSCMFISQDTRHLTRAGAIYFARLLDNSRSFTLVSGQSRTLGARAAY
jgi:peptidoglycan/LPS O-acetylase OafA/YrhL